MAILRASIVHPTGTQKTTVQVPDNVASERLIKALVGRMGLPLIGENNWPLNYRLTYTRDGQEEAIGPDETLDQVGVQNDDVLRLYAEPEAGPAPSNELYDLLRISGMVDELREQVREAQPGKFVEILRSEIDTKLEALRQELEAKIEQKLATTIIEPGPQADYTTADHQLDIYRQFVTFFEGIRSDIVYSTQTGIQELRETNRGLQAVTDQHQQELNRLKEVIAPGSIVGGVPDLTDELNHLQELRRINRKRLQALEVEQAKKGMNAPAEVTTEIGSLRDSINEIDARIKITKHDLEELKARST